jgi:hypothetical protein
MTVLTLYQLLWLQTRDTMASVVAAILFATVPTFWSQAIRAEVYTLHTWLMVMTLFLWWHAHAAVRRASFIMCFVFLGLGMAHHPTTVFLWASLLVCAWWEDRCSISSIGAATSLGLGVAAICYLYFPWRSQQTLAIDYVRPYFHIDPGTFSGIWWMISLSAFRCQFYLDLSPGALVQGGLQFLHLYWMNFLGIGLILSIWGWFRLRKEQRHWNRLLSIYFLTQVVAFLLYHTIDKEVMFLPMYVVGSLWAAGGIQALSDWTRAHWPLSTTRHVNILVQAVLLLIIGAGVSLNWTTIDLHQDRRIREFASRVLQEVEPSTLIVNHWVTASALDYLRVVEGQRPDVMGFNLDLYFLGAQTQCRTLSDSLVQQAWFAWLDVQRRRRPLCFIEPLPPLPDDLRWLRQGTCWTVAAQ